MISAITASPTDSLNWPIKTEPIVKQEMSHKFCYINSLNFKHGKHVEAADQKKPAKENCGPRPAASLSDRATRQRTARLHASGRGISRGLPLQSQPPVDW